MFSGLVCVGTLRSLGSSSLIDWVTTGIVIRKMISSTSITSTSGRGVDGRVHLLFAVVAGRADVHGHGELLQSRGQPLAAASGACPSLAGRSTLCTVARTSRTRVHHALLRRISQL
jgi:hypothetical protein